MFTKENSPTVITKEKFPTIITKEKNPHLNCKRNFLALFAPPVGGRDQINFPGNSELEPPHRMMMSHKNEHSLSYRPFYDVDHPLLPKIES